MKLEEKVALFFAQTRYRGSFTKEQFDDSKREAIEQEDWSAFGERESDAKQVLLSLSELMALDGWLLWQSQRRPD